MNFKGREYENKKYIGADGGYEDLKRGKKYWISVEKKGKYNYVYRMFRRQPYVFTDSDLIKSWTNV